MPDIILQPEFSLRYKMPRAIQSTRDIAHFRAQVDEIAQKVQVMLFEIFGQKACWEAREFEHSGDQPDFSIIVWLTDEKDTKCRPAMIAQNEIILMVQQLIYKDQTVGCRFIRVRDSLSVAHGLKL